MLKQNSISKPLTIIFRQFKRQDSLKMRELGEKVLAVVFIGLIAVRRSIIPATAEGFVECD
jgi:hypothetical protein